MTKYGKYLFFMTAVCLYGGLLFAQEKVANMAYVVTMEPESHYFDIALTYKHIPKKDFELKISAWAPGDYRIHNYQAALVDFKATDAAGKVIKYEKPSKNVWLLHASDIQPVTITYRVKADTASIDNNFVDENRAIITPAAMFFYADGELKHPIIIQIKPYSKWNGFVATGLDSLPGKKNIFAAANFDILFDSPFFMGNVEQLPPFTIKGVPHYFVAYGLGNFDRNVFMGDLKKIVTQGIDIIGDIPYSHYTFLDIGPGPGGIEHLNSTSVSFRTPNIISSPEIKKRTYALLAHEYFHLYNVKRIRPIALGPFDYSKENYTNMLWVSEGITDYYAYLMVRHAGLLSDEDLLKAYQTKIGNYENKPGHLMQSATEASRDTWNDSPFGKTEAQANKSISYYEKGLALGILLDFKIRHETSNKRSLDDVMRKLYTKYYQTLKRGFTDQEFQTECEKMAGVTLAEIFEYASTVKPVNYAKYFAYAGLDIDTVTRARAYLGISPGVQREANLLIGDVKQQSPAWNAGLRAGDKILTIDGKEANLELYNAMLQNKNSGNVVQLKAVTGGETKEIPVKLGSRLEKSFAIKKMLKRDDLQERIYRSWIGE